MNSSHSQQTDPKTASDDQPDSVWQKIPFADLLRYKPSKVYFARIRIRGKLIRRSLKTKLLTVARMRFG